MSARTFLTQSISDLIDRDGLDALSHEGIASCLDALEAEYATETHPIVPRLWSLVDRLRCAYLELPGADRMPRVEAFDDGSGRRFNAFAALDRVYVSVQLDHLPEPELAFIVAHELGHIFHGDSESVLSYAAMSGPAMLAHDLRRRLSSQAREHRADDFARELVKAAGYPDASPAFFERMCVKDPRSEIRWNGLRRVPLVGRALDRLRKAAESMKYSHPYTEERLARARAANPTHEPAVESRCWRTPDWSGSANRFVDRCRHPGKPRCGHNLVSGPRPRPADFW